MPAVAVDQLAPPSVEVRWSVAATDDTESAGVPVTVTDAAFVHAPVAPETVTVGLLRSSRTVSGVAHADVLPTASTARNRTSVSPWAEMTALAPDCGVPHVDPALVLDAHWYPALPEPVSAPPLAVIVVEAEVSQAVEPPAADGAAGAVRSRRTEPVPPASPRSTGPRCPRRRWRGTRRGSRPRR